MKEVKEFKGKPLREKTGKENQRRHYREPSKGTQSNETEQTLHTVS